MNKNAADMNFYDNVYNSKLDTYSGKMSELDTVWEDIASNQTENVLQISGKKNGVWYGFGPDATNKPNASINYGAVRVVVWSTTNYSNASVEVISFTSPFRHYYNHYLNTVGWSGWREVTEGAGYAKQSSIDSINSNIGSLSENYGSLSTQITSVSSEVSSLDKSLSTMGTNLSTLSDTVSKIIMGKAFSNRISLNSGDHDYSFPITCPSGYVPIAIKNFDISENDKQYLNSWMFTENDLLTLGINSNTSGSYLISIVVIFASLSAITS